MARNGITKRGDLGLVKALQKFEKEYIREVKRVIAETAELLAAQAKLLAPVNEGDLKRSIDIEYDRIGLTAKITVGVAYGIYVEMGTGIYAVNGNGRKDAWVYFANGRYYYTRGMRAQPFFNPAFETAARHFHNQMNRLG